MRAIILTEPTLPTDLYPGAHVVLLGTLDGAFKLRKLGLELRDTILLVSPPGTCSFAFLFRKPFKGTVAANVLLHGTGALNIDACRVGTGDDLSRNNADGENGWKNSSGGPNGAALRREGGLAPLGRFPPNILLLHSPDCVGMGTREVPTDNFAGHPDGASRATFGADDRPRASAGYGDGHETIPAYDCAPGCPVATLDKQTGATTNTRHMSYNRSGTGFIGTIPSQPEKDWHMTETGYASRFFPQFMDEAGLRSWLETLIGIK